MPLQLHYIANAFCTFSKCILVFYLLPTAYVSVLTVTMPIQKFGYTVEELSTI